MTRSKFLVIIFSDVTIFLSIFATIFSFSFFNKSDHYNPAVLAATDVVVSLTESIEFNNIQTLTSPIITQKVETVVTINYGLPTQLIIPKINVNATFDYVGLTSNGDMDTSSNPIKATWYKLGPHPGEIGSSVIGGHYGWVDNKPAIFDSLNKLQPGDKIYVKDKNNVTATFVVRESKNYDYLSKVADVFTSDDGLSHLNLVTCEGYWNKITKSYSQRLVVFSDRI